MIIHNYITTLKYTEVKVAHIKFPNTAS